MSEQPITWQRLISDPTTKFGFIELLKSETQVNYTGSHLKIRNESWDILANESELFLKLLSLFPTPNRVQEYTNTGFTVDIASSGSVDELGDIAKQILAARFIYSAAQVPEFEKLIGRGDVITSENRPIILTYDLTKTNEVKLAWANWQQEIEYGNQISLPITGAPQQLQDAVKTSATTNETASNIFGLLGVKAELIDATNLGKYTPQPKDLGAVLRATSHTLGRPTVTHDRLSIIRSALPHVSLPTDYTGGKTHHVIKITAPDSWQSLKAACQEMQSRLASMQRAAVAS